jgi:tripartite-type tricarboxylate transporter receptor subunit TctC
VATQAPAAAKVNFPAGRPISVLVPANAGGGTDVMVRTLQPYLEKVLSTSFVIVNKGAAGGQVAITEAVKAKPDGYTIMSPSVPHHVQMAQDPERKPEYKVQDITFLACSVSDPGTLGVLPNAPWKDAKEFLEDAKKRPGEIKIAATGKGGDDHLLGLTIEDLTGAKFTYVQFDGGAPARTALLGGHVDAWLGNESEAIPLVKNKEARILFLADPKASKYSPGVPTAKEATGLDLIGYSQRGWGVAAAVPAEIKQILADALDKVHKDPEVIDKFEKMSYPIVYHNTAAWTKLVCDEQQKIDRLARKFSLFNPQPIEQPCPKA